MAEGKRDFRASGRRTCQTRNNIVSELILFSAVFLPLMMIFGEEIEETLIMIGDPEHHVHCRDPRTIR